MVGENDVQPDLADRMQKALDLAGVSVQEMADLLEVHRNSVGGWLNRRNKPSPATLRVWAMETGVPYEWLRAGNWPEEWVPPTPKLAAPEWLRQISAAHQQISAALQQIADQLE